MSKNWQNKNVTILGLSLSGISAAKYLTCLGAKCIISERRAENPNDIQKIKELNSLNIDVEMGEHKFETIINADLIIVSPGIPPRAEVIKLAEKNNIEVISDIELSYQESETPFIAITGTNGKTTTTKLISEIFKNAEYNAPSCGNIGVPPTKFLRNDEKTDFFIAELSSFQIHYSQNFKPFIGIFLNYTPDHIDWHGSEEEYLNAKKSLFSPNRKPNWAILNAKDTAVMSIANNYSNNLFLFGIKEGKNCIYEENNKIIQIYQGKMQEVIDIEEIPLIGKHNIENIMAAIATATIAGIDKETIKKSIISYKAPEHRLEYVCSINGVKYYNDSKATNCDSAINALKSFENKKLVLIAGGKDKGTDLSDFVENIKKYTENTILIGEAADRFQENLETKSYKNIIRAKSLEDAIDISMTIKTEAVLLSPACASFDMYKNFEERGNAFKDYVKSKS